MGDPVGGAHRGGDLAFAQPGLAGGCAEDIERIRGRDITLGQAARGPEQAPVPLTLTTPRHPAGEHLRIRPPPLKPSSTRTVDRDRSARVQKLAQPHRIHWHWVRGHAGHEGNERADELANRGVPALR